MHDDSNNPTDRPDGGSIVGQSGQSVIGYALVAVAFVVVLVLVMTTLGDSIGEGLDSLLETISQPFTS
ncbi:MAG: hypothetical protein OXG79_11735 [Chloroflexi bacterium]|nr:hypothetical protein [Chloroflexota bacterium]MCY4110449.1 hypothetical protein [Chloroflexota bacterium]